MDYLITLEQLKHYTKQLFQGTGQKERSDMILEPLQSMIILSLLGFSPKGTKLTLQGNLLSLQPPAYSQGVVRWIQNDTKEDLYYLFHIFKRFTVYYKHLQDIQDDKISLYDLLLLLAKRGLERLQTTYSQHSVKSLQHTLRMYHAMLEHPEAMTSVESISDEQTMVNEAFSRIHSIYTNEQLLACFYTLQQMVRDEENCECYIDATQSLMKGTWGGIEGWIRRNMLF